MSTTNLALAQKMASLQGALFEQNCSVALECAGFEISGRHVLMKEIGIEVDIIATNQQGISFFITCKGSMRGERPGSRRTDTLKKALCDAFLLSQEGWTPVILMTSHVPNKGSGRAMLDAVPRCVLYDVVNPWNHGARLQWLALAREGEIQQDMLRSPQDVYAKNWQLTPSHPTAKLAFPKNAHMVERLLAEASAPAGTHGSDTDISL